MGIREVLNLAATAVEPISHKRIHGSKIHYGNSGFNIRLLDSDEEDEPEEVTRCVCNKTHNSGMMIQCESCLVWQHCFCVGIKRKKNIPKKYLCEMCTAKKKKIAEPVYQNDHDKTQQHNFTENGKQRNTLNSREAALFYDNNDSNDRKVSSSSSASSSSTLVSPFETHKRKRSTSSLLDSKASPEAENEVPCTKSKAEESSNKRQRTSSKSKTPPVKVESEQCKRQSSPPESSPLSQITSSPQMETDTIDQEDDLKKDFAEDSATDSACLSVDVAEPNANEADNEEGPEEEEEQSEHCNEDVSIEYMKERILLMIKYANSCEVKSEFDCSVVCELQKSFLRELETFDIKLCSSIQ